MRAFFSVPGRDLHPFSRNRRRLNERYPEIASALHRQESDSFIADGEIVTFKDGVTSFATLQQRMQAEHPTADRLRRVAAPPVPRPAGGQETGRGHASGLQPYLCRSK